MKKVITVNDLCCERCAKQMAVRLSLLDGVRAAKANYKRKVIFVDVTESVSDESLKSVFQDTEIQVLSIEKRKGIFG